MLVWIKDLLHRRRAPPDPQRALEVHFFCAVKPPRFGKILAIQEPARRKRRTVFQYTSFVAVRWLTRPMHLAAGCLHRRGLLRKCNGRF
jgi:hypothetical protein